MKIPGEITFDGFGINVSGQRLCTLFANVPIPVDDGWSALTTEELQYLGNLLGQSKRLFDCLMKLSMAGSARENCSCPAGVIEARGNLADAVRDADALIAEIVNFNKK